MKDWFVSYIKLTVLGSALALVGCGGAERGQPAGASEPDTTPSLSGAQTNAGAPCEDWSTIECGVEVASHDGIVDCARGVRLCQNGVYGACVADASRGVVSVQAPDIALPTKTHTGVMAVGGTSTDCADDPCNPFCQVYLDEPNDPIEADREDTPTGALHGGSLQSSNLPPSFKNKGSLDAQCSNAPGSQSWNEACQFDQHCVDGACAAWEPGESGDCTGIDITTPTTCVPSASGKRVLTVCNRGTKEAPAGINCFGFSGGSPQFPNSDPGDSNRLLMTTQQTLAAGECETQLIDEDLFHQNGIQSVSCNPPQEHLVTGTVSSYPSVSATAGALPWTSPNAAFAADTNYASASPANPNGTTTAAVAPTASSAFGSDETWTDPHLAFAAGSGFATAAPAAPAGGAGTLGTRYPGGFDNPAATGEIAFSNPDRIYAADGSYVTASPANPSTMTTATAAPSAHDSASGWLNHGRTYVSDSLHATAKLTAAGTADTVVSGFGLNVPTSAILDSFELRVKWKTDVNSTKYSLSAQALTGATSTAIGGALAKSGSYTTESTDVLTLPASSLTAFNGSHLSSTALKVRLRFSRANGNVTDSTASVDFVQVVVKYHLPSTTASVAYRYFGLASIPSNAQVTLTAEVKWKASAVNSNLKLGMQLYKNWGSASQAPVGSEVTRTPAAANTDYVDSTPTLNPSPADLSDTSFAIRLRAVRSDGAVNPDVIASIDYVRVTVSWSMSLAVTTHSVYLKGFGLDQLVPANATITSVASTASWKLSQATLSSTLGLQAYKANGTTALGTEVTDITGPTSLVSATQTVSGGVAVTDLANLGVRVRITRSAVPSADFTAQLDAVTVAVTWTAPGVEHAVSYGNFGFDGALPSNATVTQIKTEVRWRSSVASGRQALGFRLFGAGNVALGSEFVDTSSPTSFTVRTQTLTGLSLSHADLANGTFTVKVRSTRNAGTNNPDFTAYLDYVRVTLTYSELQDNAVDECNADNNWTATKLNPSPDECVDMSTPQYVPFTVTRVFQAICPTGQLPTWRRFGYTTATPGATSVEFRFRSFAPTAGGTCTALSAVTSGTPAPLATASASGDPQVCLTSDPACVVDLSQNLGADGSAGLECLQMDAYGIPSDSDSPQLFDWTVLYDCLDGE